MLPSKPTNTHLLLRIIVTMTTEYREMNVKRKINVAILPSSLLLLLDNCVI